MGRGAIRLPRLRGVFVAATLLLAFATPAPSAAPARAQPAAASWSVLVYVAAENLYPGALLEIPELHAAAGADVRVIALIDRPPLDRFAGDGGADLVAATGIGGIAPWEGAKLLEIQADSARELADLGAIDSSHPQTLAWFLWWGLTNYPSERTAVILHDHGGGALATFAQDLLPGPDGLELSWMSLPEVETAFRSALRAAGRDRFDLVAFATCLNATLEVARTLAPHARYLVASQELVWWHTATEPGSVAWHSNNVAMHAFSVLDGGGVGVDGAGLGQALLDAHDDHASQTELLMEPRGDYTMSLIDLDQVARVDTALGSFVRAVEADLALQGPALLQARSQVLAFGLAEELPRVYGNMVDLGDLLARLPAGLDPSVVNARNALYQALETAVVDTANGPDAAAATGLSIYLPPNGQVYMPDYREIADPSGWSRMVERLLTRSSTPPPEVAAGGFRLDTRRHGWLASLGVADPAGLAGATAGFGLPRSDGTTTVVGMLPALVGAGGADQVQASWNYQYLTLDGQPVSAKFEPGPRHLTATIPGRYAGPGGPERDVVLRLTVRVDSDRLVPTGDIQVVDLGGTAAHGVEPGSTFAAIRFVADRGTVIGDEVLPVVDLTAAPLGVGEVRPGGEFVASINLYAPDGSRTGRGLVDTRP